MRDEPGPLTKTNLFELADEVESDWENFVLARVNDHVVRVSVISREFHWHVHNNSDETFIVLDGTFEIDLEDRTERLQHGDCFTVPRGVRHRTRGVGRAINLAVEREDTDVSGD